MRRIADPTPLLIPAHSAQHPTERMTTVAAETSHQHPQVITVGEGEDADPEAGTNHVDSEAADGRKRQESESELEDRGSDAKLDGSDAGPERRCTSASAAGESEYESVDEGDDSIKETAEKTRPEMEQTSEDIGKGKQPPTASREPEPEQKEQYSAVLLRSDAAQNCAALSICWADVSERSDSLDALEEKVLGESVENIKKVNENELQVGKNLPSAEVNHPEALDSPIREEGEDDDEDENYEDIESDASERQSSREEVIDSEEEDEAAAPNDDDGKQTEGDDGDEEIEAASDQPAKPLDDDEDMRKPQYIPKRGAFYEHDDRLGSDGEAKPTGDRESVTSDSSQPKPAKTLIISSKKSTPARTPNKEHADSKIVKVESERWGHDMFKEEEQKPKSREELLTSYGYDIRSQDTVQKAVRYNKRGVAQSKSNRSWKEESDRSPNPKKGCEEPVPGKSIASQAPVPASSAASRANEKIAMRETYQESERRRHDRESKPPQREQLQRDRPAQRAQEPSNRRSFERSDRRSSEDMPAPRNPILKKPFSRDDFPELTSQRPGDYSQRKARDEPAAWSRTIATNNNASGRRRDQSSDESQERPVVRTVVYSSSRFPKDSRSSKSDTHNSYTPPANGIQRAKHDRRDRMDYRDNRQTASFRKAAPRQSEPATHFTDQDGRNDRSQRSNRRDGQKDRGSNRQTSHKDNGQEAAQFNSDSPTSLSAGIQKLAIDQRSNQRQRVPASDSQIMSNEPESRPKRYSATRSQAQQPPLPSNPANIGCTDPSSHHPAVAHQQMAQQVNQPPPPPPPPHQFYDPGPQSPPEYYPEVEGPGYAAYPPDPSGFMAHHQRYISSHPVAPGPTPPASLAVIPPPAAAFLPTFTPSLPPSGFPQYPPPPQQYHHPMGPPVAGPTGPPPVGSDMFRGSVDGMSRTMSITYYDTTQQQPIRSLPPKRPKNIIPILPPPEVDGHQQDVAHLDNSNAGY